MLKQLTVKNCRAFTLIETVVALGVLLLGIIASLTLMLSAFNYVRRTEQQIVVVNLAREGIEIIRSVRNNEGDNSALFDIASEQNFIVDTGTRDAATLLSFTNQVTANTLSQCAKCTLYLDNGRYTHTVTTEPTPFKRMITIAPRGVADYEKTIISQVSWTDKGRTYNYTLEGLLTNWQ